MTSDRRCAARPAAGRCQSPSRGPLPGPGPGPDPSLRDLWKLPSQVVGSCGLTTDSHLSATTTLRTVTPRS
eukprot:691904-Hanusia_phi.AAC.1